jgi:hypothetical protein
MALTAFLRAKTTFETELGVAGNLIATLLQDART